MLSFVVLGSIVAFHAGCAGLIGAPPTRADVGSVAVARNGQVQSGVRGSVGAHWASGTRTRKVPFDIGAGVVYERALRGTQPLDPTAQKNGYLPDVPMQEAPPQAAWGGYLEASARLSARGNKRSWLGARTEVMRVENGGPTSISLMARASWEVYGAGAAAGADSSSNAFVMFAGAGTLGAGFYLESGVRHTASGGNEFLTTGGVSLRMPAFLLFFIGCK